MQLTATLRSVWESVLACSLDDIDADFFDLGGDSLLALQVASEIGQLGFRVNDTVVFEHPTIRALAHFLELQRRDPT